MYEASTPSLSYSLFNAHPVRQSVKQFVDMLHNNYRDRGWFPPSFILETHKIWGNYAHLAPALLVLSPS